jgi:hypothetical protein
MIFIGLTAKTGIRAGMPLQLKTGISHTCADLPPLPSVEATGVCIPIENTEMFLAPVNKSLKRLWSDTDITKLLGFRNKSILAGDLNAKHPVWYSKVSNPTGLKLLELYVSYNSDISALRITHLMVEVMLLTL